VHVKKILSDSGDIIFKQLRCRRVCKQCFNGEVQKNKNFAVGKLCFSNSLCRISASGGNNLKSVANEFLEDIVSIGVFGFLSLK
jgi:hypothetical protein